MGVPASLLAFCWRLLLRQGCQRSQIHRKFILLSCDGGKTLSCAMIHAVIKPEHLTSGHMPIRVAIVEDTREIREGLAFLINSSPGFSCVAACGSAEDALLRLPKSIPDVTLMDIQLPGMSGIECIRLLKSRLPAMQIMMLTIFEDHDRIFQSLMAGASGYLIKKTPPQRIIEAIQDLHMGGSPMSNQIARRVVDAFRQPACFSDGKSSDPSVLQQLSSREQEILHHLAQGFLYKEIAESLRISIETVRTHIRHIYEKLHVRSRTEAVLKAFPGTNGNHSHGDRPHQPWSP